MQEIADGLATACSVLDAVRASGQIPEDEFPQVVGRISFFVDVGVRFVEELCKMRALFTELWERITLERYGVTDPKLRRFRYGMQVNSLGLTEEQPENNVQRIVLEMLGVTLSKDAAPGRSSCRGTEALGLPTPWDQQWSLRMQQVLADETDLLEYDDLFTGSTVVEAKTAELAEAASAELEWVLDGGGAFEMIDAMKGRLVQSNTERVRRIESGEQIVVGVNSFDRDRAVTPRVDSQHSIVVVDPGAEREQIERLQAWCAARDSAAAARRSPRFVRRARSENLVPATIALARAGGTVGEWAGALRDVFGEYRAPTGVARSPFRSATSRPSVNASRPDEVAGWTAPAARRQARSRRTLERRRADRGGRPRRRPRGHLPGIRLTPQQIALARDEDVDVVGLSILSGSHLELVPETIRLLREQGVDVPIVVGGIIPDEDRAKLRDAGVARVYTPKDYRLTTIVGEIAELAIDRRERLPALPLDACRTVGSHRR